MRVVKVITGSPADKAGIKIGDIFLKLDGEVIAAGTPSDQDVFDNLIRQNKIASGSELTGVRAGKPLTISVTLGRQPKPASELAEHKDDHFEFTARELSLNDRLEAKLGEGDQGVRIANVQNAGWAALAGLSSGDTLMAVDGLPVSGLDALKSSMLKLRESSRAASYSSSSAASAPFSWNSNRNGKPDSASITYETNPDPRPRPPHRPRPVHARRRPRRPMARKLFAAQQDSVVWVSAVIKISISAEGGKEGVNIPDREQKVEALATFIDDKGMLVTALSSIDPTKQISGQEIRTASGTTKIEASATMKEVKIIMPDSTEVPGEVVLRDADLDLAFIRPKAGSKEAEGLTYKPIDLKSAGTSIPTDEVIVIARQNEILSRVPTVIIGQVMAVTKSPARFSSSTEPWPAAPPTPRAARCSASPRSAS